MRIKFLGAHNAESATTKLASILIDGVLALDAGSLGSELSFAEQEQIRAIVLSHGHYDHIRGVPAFAFANSSRKTKVLGSTDTLAILSSHLLDGVIYPKFAEHTSFLGRAALDLVALEPLNPLQIEGYTVVPTPVNHIASSLGLEIVSPRGRRVFYTGDTGPGLASAWAQVSPHLLIAEVTFPDRLSEVAGQSRHLCPGMLESELGDFRALKGYLPDVVVTHLSPGLQAEIEGEVARVSARLRIPIGIAFEGREVTL